MFLFQPLSVAIRKGNAVAFLSTFDTKLHTVVVDVLLDLIFRPAALCGGYKREKKRKPIGGSAERGKESIVGKICKTGRF